MTNQQNEICPHCGSNDNSRINELIQCNNCPFSWKPDLKWISRVMASMFHNVGWDLEKKLTEAEQRELVNINKAAIKKRDSARKIAKEDPVSALTIYLSAFEYLMMAIKKVISPFVEKIYSFSHEVKLFAYYGYAPKSVLERKNQTKYKVDEVFLFIDVGAKKPKPRNFSTEDQFFEVEENFLWKDYSQRNGAIFRAGKYFHSDKWTRFCTKENRNLEFFMTDLPMVFGLLFLRKGEVGLPFGLQGTGTGKLEIFESRNELHKRFKLKLLEYELINSRVLKPKLQSFGSLKIGDDLISKLNENTVEIINTAIWRAFMNGRKTVYSYDV